jgi:hypothetical protein
MQPAGAHRHCFKILSAPYPTKGCVPAQKMQYRFSMAFRQPPARCALALICVVSMPATNTSLNPVRSPELILVVGG